MSQKAVGECPQVARVSLNTSVLSLVKKYRDRDGLNEKPLIHYFSEIQYVYQKNLQDLRSKPHGNDSESSRGKRKEEERPLDEIASSHLAWRTFIGTLYKKVKAPNLVGSLSGRKEGSKAFIRYRDIDEDMKKELVRLLD